MTVWARTMRLIGRGLASALLLTGLTLPFGSVTVMAAWNDCPVGQVCWWTNSNGTGPWGHRTGNYIDWESCWSMGSVGNTASSWRTRLSAPYSGVVFHNGGGTSCYGNTLTVSPQNQSVFVGVYDNWLGGISVY